MADGRKVHLFEERPDALPENAALLLNFHGGGFIKGRTDRDRRYCCTLMEQLNCLVWDVDYCLAPEQAFPAAVEETYGIMLTPPNTLRNSGSTRRRSSLPGTVPVETLLPPRLSKMRRSIGCIPAAHCSNISLWTTRSIRSTGSPRSCGPIRSGSSVPRRKSCTPTLCRGCRPRRSAVFPAQGGRDCAGRFPGLPDPLRRGGQPAERHRGVRAPAHQGRDLRDSTAHPGSNARVHDQPHPRLGARTGSTLQIFRQHL